MPSRTQLWMRPLVAGMLSLMLTTAVSAKTFKIATVMPDGSGWLTEMRAAANAIKKETDGRVKIKFYPGGVMGSDKTVMRKVRVGQLHGGAFTSGALASVYPDIELYSLPLMFRNFSEVDYVRGQMDARLKEGLIEAGFVPLSFNDGGFAYLLSQKPVRRVEDLSGAKVWIPEDDIMSQTAFDVAGVAPVPLPIADVYTALQTGLVDTVAAPPAGSIAFQWHTKVNYLTDVPLMYLVGILAVDKKSFDSISPADQAIVQKHISAAAQRLDEEGRAGDENAREALKKQGIEFVEASSDAEVQRWQKMSSDALDKLRGLGRYDDKLIDELLRHLQTTRSGEGAAAQ